MKFVILAAAALTIPASAIAQVPEEGTDTAFDAMDANKDGRVERAEHRAYVEARYARESAGMDAAFVEMDKNGDGNISKAEAAAVPVIASAFAALDTSGDDRLSQAELHEALAKARAVDASR